MLEAISFAPHTGSSPAASDLLGFAEMQNLTFLPGIDFTPAYLLGTAPTAPFKCISTIPYK